MYYQQNVLNMQKNGPRQCFTITYDDQYYYCINVYVAFYCSNNYFIYCWVV